MGSRERADVSRQLGELLDAPDVLSSVIRGDRHRSGRSHGETPQPDNHASPPESLSVRTPYDRQTDLPPASEADLVAVPQAGLPPPLADGKPRAAPRAKPGLTARRVEEARRLATSATTTVTLRVPRGLNEWLDEYVHRSWPVRVRKQELVAEALRLLFARRGRAGEPVLATELLSGEES